MINIIIPTFQKYNKIADMVSDIEKHTHSEHRTIPICYKASAAENRNRGLAECSNGDIVIMVDDDIRGFYDGWEKDLIAPIKAGGVSLVSARLLDKNGNRAPCNGDTGDMASDMFTAIDGHVPSAAIAFVKDFLIFDENYQGAGYEDTDFCEQIKRAYPKEKIVINNKCKLTHLHESKHLGGNTPNKPYYHNKWNNNVSLDVVIFSKDRAAQLDVLIQSIKENLSAAHNTLHVLYTTSNVEHFISYENLKNKYRNVYFHQQGDFCTDTKIIINHYFSKKYCMMFADDEIVTQKTDITEILTQYTDDVQSASLRLGESVDYCQPARAPMQQPTFERIGNVIRWNWTTGDQFKCWNYPRSVIGTIHRTDTIRKVLGGKAFRNPNELEVVCGAINADKSKPHMISYTTSRVLCIPANHVNPETRTPMMDISADDLNTRYTYGERILTDNLYGIKDNKSCFPEVPYIMRKPSIGIFYNEPRKVDGCAKVAANTMRGLDILGLPYERNRICQYNGMLHMVAQWRELPRNTWMGVETMVLPRENYEAWNLFDKWLTPCEWVTKSYRTDKATVGKRIVEWPAGVDTERFTPDDVAVERDCLIYYKTVTKQTTDADLKRLTDTLDAGNVSYSVIKYGAYTEDEFIRACNTSRCAIWLAGTESQNIALLECMAMGVPVLVYDQTLFQYNGFEMQGASSAPYFDDRCGVKRIGREFDISDIKAFIGHSTACAYNPRDYVLENFTLDRCARKYYDIVTNT